MPLYFHLVDFIEHIWHKTLLMGYPKRLEITRVCSLNGFQMAMGLFEGHSSLFLRVLFNIMILFTSTVLYK